MKTGAIKSGTVKPNPTLNRLQNFLLHQRNQRRKELEMRMRAQQSFALRTIKQIAQPRIQRMKTQMWLIPRSRTFKLLMVCSAAYLGMRGY